MFPSSSRSDCGMGGVRRSGRSASLVSLKRAPDDHDLAVTARRLALAALPDDLLGELHGYWLGKLTDAKLPARHDIDPLDFHRALGRVCLLDVWRDPLVFRYRVDGSLIAKHRRCDLTGRSTDEMRPLAIANVFRAEFSHLVETAAPNYFEVSCTRSIQSARYRVLAVPLSGDGVAVDMILAAALGTESLQSLL